MKSGATSAGGEMGWIAESFYRSRTGARCSESIIIALFCLDRTPTDAALEETLSRLAAACPLTRSTVDDTRREWCGVRQGSPVWRIHPPSTFPPQAHIHRATLPGAPASTAVEEYIGEVMHRPFDHALPLWEVHMVTYEASEACDVVWRIHHSLGDGILLVEVLTRIVCEREAAAPSPGQQPKPLQITQQPEPEPQPQKRRKGVGAVTLAWNTVVATWRVLTLPFTFADRLQSGHPVRTPTVTECKTFAMVPGGWALEKAKVAALAYGATINDIITAAIMQGLANMLQAERTSGHRLGSEQIRLLALVNTRVKSQAHLDKLLASYREESNVSKATVDISYLVQTLPCGPMSAAKRVGACKSELDFLKSSPMSAMLSLLCHCVRLLFGFGFFWWFVTYCLAKASGYMSNLAGPRHALVFAGCPVRDMRNCVVPMVWGMGFSVISYNGRIGLACSGDGSVMPLPRLRALMASCDQAFKDICAEADSQYPELTIAEENQVNVVVHDSDTKGSIC